jgi:membrane-bound lytic murein transglycosylase D
MRARRLFVVAVTGLLVGCGAHLRPAPPAPSYSLPIKPFRGFNAPQVALALDAVSLSIAEAEREFNAGKTELAVGHRVAARERFDAAVDVLLSVPGGARSDPRVEVAFDRLLDRISALENLELRAGDGFAEAHTEPAAIDNLLSVGIFERPEMATATTEEMVTADLEKTRHDVPIHVNDKVLAYIELFRGRLRSFMEDSLERGSHYIPMIQDVFKSEGLPLDLSFVPLIESAFKPTALSKAAAKGLWQFEADTAKDQGLEQNWFLDERSDPEKATRAAAQYLKMLRDMFDGDWNMALASYNAGMGRVQRAAKLARTGDYWEMSASSRYLPRETREYVPMILAAIIIGANPTHYGFDIDLAAPMAYERVQVPDALSLGVVAEWLSIPVEQIQTLNPELRRGMTPLGNHELKVPIGTAETVEARLHDASPSIFASASFRWHTVKKGETLAAIARKYKITTAKLASANDLRTSSRVRGGTTLMVPVGPASALAAAYSAPDRPVANGSASSSTSTKASTNTRSSTRTSTYKVRPGDTLSRIAQKFDVSVQALKQLNRLSSNTIVVGETLTVRR